MLAKPVCRDECSEMTIKRSGKLLGAPGLSCKRGLGDAIYTFSQSRTPQDQGGEGGYISTRIYYETRVCLHFFLIFSFGKASFCPECQRDVMLRISNAEALTSC